MEDFRDRLPGLEAMHIDPPKITEYLLSPTSPEGRDKEKVFTAFGFDWTRPEELAAALRLHGWAQPVVSSRESEYGIQYAVVGPMATPDGRTLRVKSVWQVLADSTFARLITAYPA